MLGPLPRRFADCFYLLLHLHHRPSPTVNGSACRFYPLKRLRSGGLFAGCSHFLMFKPHSLLATLVAPTTTVSCRAVSDVYIRAKRASLPPHVPDMLAVRNTKQAIDGTGTFTPLDPQSCRLLLTVLSLPPRRSAMSHRSARAMPCCLRPEPGSSASGSKFCFEATCGFTFVTAR